MKRLRCQISALACTAILLFVWQPHAAAFQWGDINGDGNLNAIDARLALRASALLETLTDIQHIIGDVDSDGQVTAMDARLILRASANIITLPGLPPASATKPTTTAPATTLPSPLVDFPAQQQNAAAFEKEVVRLVNEYRAKNGLNPLIQSASLNAVATIKNRDMHDNHYFSHKSPVYGYTYEILDAQNIPYLTMAENIAVGYRTPKAVMDAWIASPTHRPNLLNPRFRQIGMGYLESGHYWTQVFTD